MNSRKPGNEEQGGRYLPFERHLQWYHYGNGEHEYQDLRERISNSDTCPSATLLSVSSSRGSRWQVLPD